MKALQKLLIVVIFEASGFTPILPFLLRRPSLMHMLAVERFCFLYPLLVILIAVRNESGVIRSKGMPHHAVFQRLHCTCSLPLCLAWLDPSAALPFCIVIFVSSSAYFAMQAEKLLGVLTQEDEGNTNRPHLITGLQAHEITQVRMMLCCMTCCGFHA